MTKPSETKPNNEQGERRRGVSTTANLTHQRVKGRSRFYKEVTTRKVAREEGGGEARTGTRLWEVLLDGRVLKTPARNLLQVM